ncbi:MAG: hypothetical protein HC862_32160 [Scytonema sp. RU_4_4]|nr:hypothetical protein [Scytonema sp. RU_4_4]NJR74624.1 hypothetical protein [Scytonema sp. CRU_2_7]
MTTVYPPDVSESMALRHGDRFCAKLTLRVLARASAGLTPLARAAGTGLTVN